MKSIAFLASALALCISATLADESVSQDEAKSVQAALQEWGCQGGRRYAVD